MDPWYLLKCGSCRATLRIKSDYVHMRGKCPACNMRIEPPLPKPLSFDSDPSSGPLDEEWPEPATLVHRGTDQDAGSTGSYTLNPVTGVITNPEPRPKVEEEEEPGGVYALAFDPDMPKVSGVTRSAEWDQGTTKPATTVLAVRETVAASPPTAAPAAVDSAPAAATPFQFKTEIDPLFGDEIKVPVPASEQATATPVQPMVKSTSVPAPVAKVATPEDLVAAQTTSTSDGSSTDTPRKKKKKKPDTPPADQPAGNLDTPTTETHQYALSEAEVNRIKPDAPPKSLFFDKVFNFPWTGNNIFPWIWLTLGFTMNFLLMSLIFSIAENDSQMAKVGAGAMAMGNLVLMVLVLSYGSGCWLNTINYTSAGSVAVDWETDGFRENVIHFLRIGYYYAIAALMCTPLFVFNFFSVGTILWLLGTLFVFPVFLLSGMASMTFWNFMNGEVIKRIMKKSHHYLFMYLLSVAVFFVSGVALYFSMRYGWLCLLSGPMFAAAWLIYGRLLGRMAYVLQQEPRKKKKKKKKPAVDAQAAESTEETVVEGMPANEKGPREDARGPGGARPV